jgi:hypothetical protein
MRSLLRILSLPFLLALPVSGAFAASAYIHDLQGTMNSQYGTAAPRALRTGDTVDPGVILSTGNNGTAIVKFEDGQLVVLRPNTRFAVREYSYNSKQIKDSNVVFALLQGGLRFVTGVIGSTNRNAFRLTVGTATIGVRGTSADVIYSDIANLITAAVDQGSITLLNAGVVTNVETGQFTTGSLGQVMAAARPIAQAAAPLLAQLAQTRGIVLPNNLPIVVEASARAVAAAAAARVATANAALPGATDAQKALATQAQALAESTLQTAITAATNAVVEAAKQQGVVLPPPPPPPVPVIPPAQQTQQLQEVLKQLVPTPTPTPTPTCVSPPCI